MKTDGLLPCARICTKNKTNCLNKECPYWINFPQDNNCCLISIFEHGPMTLREVAERLGISFARVKQIESGALQKLKKRGVSLELFF